MLDKDHKISIGPIYNVMQIVERLFCIMAKKTTESSHLRYSGLCHNAGLQPVLLVTKLHLKQHFCFVFPDHQRTKLSSEGVAGRELESELVSVFLLNLTCVFAVHRKEKVKGGNNSFSLISDLLRSSSGKISVGFCSSLSLSSLLKLFPRLPFSFPFSSKKELVGLKRRNTLTIMFCIRSKRFKNYFLPHILFLKQNMIFRHAHYLFIFSTYQTTAVLPPGCI